MKTFSFKQHEEGTNIRIPCSLFCEFLMFKMTRIVLSVVYNDFGKH